MNSKLIDLSLKEYFERLGKGNATPGSGSEIAHNGLCASQLIITVLKITLNKNDYNLVHKQCIRIKKEIEDIIFPNLLSLFQKDSDCFEEVIKLRKLRDKESNFKIKENINKESLKKLEESTKILIEIIKQNLLLLNHGLFCMNKCFQSVFGDSSVSISKSLSSISSGVDIIYKNLQSFPLNEWANSIFKQTDYFEKKLLEFQNEFEDMRKNLKINTKLICQNNSELEKIKNAQKGINLRVSDIENLARTAQNFLWKNKEKIGKSNKINNPLDLLKPEILIKTIGYSFEELESLGVSTIDGEMIEIAGIINNKNKSILISKKFSNEERNFTKAHELGHALLHNQLIMHRDKPLDGSTLNYKREKIEYQADK